jgi:hypothetical protein
VVAGKFAWPQPLSAVLAAVLVSCVDVLAGKLDIPLPKSDKTKQAHNGRHPQAATGRAHFAIGLFEHLDLLEEDQFQGSLPIDHIQRLKRGVEKKDLTEGVRSFSEAAGVVTKI